MKLGTLSMHEQGIMHVVYDADCHSFNRVPWLEDQYLYYFGKDNKASYATKRK